MDLASLSRTILALIGKPVSKVRLARLVYFAHKDLIRKKLMQPADIAYIRSPLGPMPEGFLSLTENSGIVASRNISSNLSYTTEDYSIDPSASVDSEITMLEQYREILASVEQTLKNLRRFSTPELIQITHFEPSWLSHQNGEVYFISAADLRLTLPGSSPLKPFRLRIRLRFSPNHPKNRAGAMQANLLRGMITDIVKESTDLEYPDETKEKSPQKPSKSSRESLKTAVGSPNSSKKSPKTGASSPKPSRESPNAKSNASQKSPKSGEKSPKTGNSSLNSSGESPNAC